jgi:uncharacterized protein YfdQ (DUF2303 family)
MEHIDIAVLQELLKYGKQSAGPQMAPGANVPYVIDAKGEPKAMPELVFNDFEREPRRVAAVVTVNDPASFVEYYNLFKDENSRTFANEVKRSVTTILDYHNAGKPSDPRWCKHRLVLQLVRSEPWNTWSAANGEKFTQIEFAEFLEQYAIDIVSPSPAAMMEVSRDLQATTEVEFGSALRNNDGQVRFKYTETTKASVGASQLQVPENFTLEIPVFIGGAEIRMDALLRFRTNQGKLTIWYTLVRPEEIIRSAFSAAREQIAGDLGITIINGENTNT